MALLFVGIVLAAFFGLTKAMGCPHCRKEAGVKLQGDEDRSIAFVEDYEDANAHPDHWCEKVILPQRGKRPEVIVLLLNHEDDDGCVWTGSQVQ